MKDLQVELVRKFREYSSDELLEKLRSDTLIELAQKIAVDELRSRGIEFVPVDDAPAQESPDQAVGYQDFETIARFSNATDAEILRGRLEAEEIPAIIPDFHMGMGNAFLLSGTGSIRVQVPRPLVAQALDIVHAVREGEFSLEQAQRESASSPAPEKSSLDTEEALLAFAQDPAWIKTWQSLVHGTGRLAGFNPFAAVMGVTWFFYRKMIVTGVIVMLADMMVLMSFGLIGVIVLVRIPAGLLANVLYYRKAESAVRGMQAGQLPPGQMIQGLKRQGGINLGAALFAVLFMVTIRIIFFA
jgi:hypothetical protein